MGFRSLVDTLHLYAHGQSALRAICGVLLPPCARTSGVCARTRGVALLSGGQPARQPSLYSRGA